MDLNGCRRFALAALLAILAPAVVAVDAVPPAPSPVAQFDAEREALLANDVATLVETLRRDGLADFARDWEDDRAKRREAPDKQSSPVATAYRREWTLLLDDEGTEVLVREWHATLADASGGAAAGNLSVALAGLFGQAIASPSRTAAERAALMDAMRAGQAWAMKVDWTDPERLRRAFGALAKAVRATGVDDPAAFADLPFEDAVAHFDGFLAAAKEIALAYDFDVDATLRSIGTREVMRDRDRATVEQQFTVFGVTVALRSDVVWRDERWIDTAQAAVEDERARGGTSEDAVIREVREQPTTSARPDGAAGSCPAPE